MTPHSQWIDVRDVHPRVVGAGQAVTVEFGTPVPVCVRLTTTRDALELAQTFIGAAQQLRNVELERIDRQRATPEPRGIGAA